jgi:tetratricopeptide (TPR) repeat protein
VKRALWCGWALVLAAVLGSLSACSRDPETAKRDHLVRANSYRDQTKLAEAVVEYKRAIQIDAKFGEAYYQLALVHERLEDPANAMREFARASDLLPDRDDVQIKAAQYLLFAQRFADARRIAENLLRKNPKNLSAQIVLANSLAFLKDMSAAVGELEKAIQMQPDRVDTYLTMAAFQVARGDPHKAETVLRNAITMSPQSVDARLGLANLRWGSGDIGETETLIKESLVLEPRHLLANRALAALYVRTGRSAEAERPLKVVAETAKTVGARLELAQYYLASGRTGEAEPILDALMKEPEGRVPATLLAARSDFFDGRRAQAQRRLDSLLTTNSKNPDALLLKAQFLLANGKPDEALQQARMAADADPRLAGPQFAMGLIYLAKADTDQALKAFNEALKREPFSVDPELQLARLHLSLGRIDLALQFAEDVVRKQPSNLDGRLTLLRAIVAHGETQRAEAEAKILAGQVPRSAAVQAFLGSVAMARKDPAAARAAFERALQLDDNTMEAFAGLVRLDIEGGRVAVARARLDAQVAKEPPNPAALEIAGRAYQTLGDTGKAERVWKKLVEVQPTNLAAYASLGQIYYSQRRLDEARAEFQQFTERNPSDVSAHTMLGVVLQLQGQLDEAQRLYERTLELNHNAPVAANNLAWLYAERGGNLDVALQWAQVAKVMLPNRAEVDDTLGWIYYKKGLPTLAVKAFQDSVHKDSSNGEAYLHLGLAYIAAGDKIRARDALENVIKMNGASKAAAEARRVLGGLG